MNTQAITENNVSTRCEILRAKLTVHPLYSALKCEKALRIFMQHHVFAVWDFMSLIKSMQLHIAPVKIPWVPPADARYAHFINQLVLEEESDVALTGIGSASHASHFESYCQAMVEVGADIRPISQFIDNLRNGGFEAAFRITAIPTPSIKFMSFTFDVIGRNQPHLLAAVLAYGRESLVPQLFHVLLDMLQTNQCIAPVLCAYLERHIQLDEQQHGPMTVDLLHTFCEGSEKKYVEAMEIAEQALLARLDFWNEIHRAVIDSCP